MIEVIYKEEKQEAQDSEDFIRIPRNIRQIGQVRDDYRIYMEDYVYTFLVRLSRSEGEKDRQRGQVAVLTGEMKWRAGVTWLFIRGAVLAKEMEAAADHIDFTEEVWNRLCEEQKKYFGEQEIVGWFFSQPQIPAEMTELFSKVHLRQFGGEKVLMLMEPQEKEEAFFRYENNEMVRQSGYYIYYEKNPGMQSYMIDNGGELQPAASEKYEDDAVKTFRQIITNKKKKNEKKAEEQPSVFSYAATACLAIAVIAVGVNFYTNYEKAAQVSSLPVAEVTPVPTMRLEKKTGKPAVTAASGTAGNPPVANTPTPTPVRRQEDMKEAQKTEKLKDMKEINEIKETDAANAADTANVSDTANTVSTANEIKEINETAGMQEEAEETGSIYRGEADVRKARRRAATHESYVIKPGDTIFQISMDKYGSMDAMQEICRLNNLSIEEIIYPGQVIVLP